jgi:hypothetical protein
MGSESAMMAAENGGHASRTNMLLAAKAPLAGHAGAAKGTDANALPYSDPCHCSAGSNNLTNKFMPRHERVLRETPLVVDHPDVGMANPGMRHANVNLVGAKFAEVQLAGRERSGRSVGGQRVDQHTVSFLSLGQCE